MWILATIWMTFLAILMLSGCRTKTVTEYISVHDTLRIHQTDTCYKVKTEYIHDTLRIEVEKIVTVNQGGDTIKLEVYKDRWRDRWNVKTDTVLKHTTDTIYRVVDSDHDKTTIKGPSWWDRHKWKLAAFALLCAVIVMAGVTFKDKIKQLFK